MRRTLAMVLSLAMGAVLLFGCADNTATAPQTGEEGAGAAEQQEKEKIIIGTSSVSIDLAESGVGALEAMGYEVEVMVFDDYFIPNTALDEGSLDANLYQHESFLEQYNDNNGTNIIMLQPKMYEFYSGLYSVHAETVEDLPDGGIVGIATDASNIDRDLQNLQLAGLITLTDAPQSGDLYSILDVVDNPKNLEFKEADHQKYLNMEDYNCLIGTSNTMAASGVDPTQNLLFQFSEAEHALGMCILPENENAQWVRDLMAAYTSDEAAANIAPESGFVPCFK